MSDNPCNIGIMHPAFAVSKSVLLDWINRFCELNYVKVENCATGAVYCQLCDCLFGQKSKVPMSRVKWDCKNEHEFVENFKWVQKCFTANNVTKTIPIEKLTKAKFQDNLEFLQWFKHFFDVKYDGQEYAAKDRRAKGVGVAGLMKRSSGTNKIGGKAASSRAAAGAPKAAAKPTIKAKPTSTGVKAAGSAKSAKMEEELEALKAKVAELQGTAEGLEKERDFYYHKLRDVELLCQQESEFETEQEKEIEKKVKDTVFNILYHEGGDAAEGDEAEAVADEEGEVAEEEEVEEEEEVC